MKDYTVDIELDTFECRVKAKNKTEAKKKALVKLKRKNPLLLIRREWKTNRKQIHVDDV